MEKLRQAIDAFGGVCAFSQTAGVRHGAIFNWFGRGAVPPQYGPTCEKHLHSYGITVNDVAPGFPWVRVPDKRWPKGLGGRPLLDCAALFQPGCQREELILGQGSLKQLTTNKPKTARSGPHR